MRTAEPSNLPASTTAEEMSTVSTTPASKVFIRLPQVLAGLHAHLVLYFPDAAHALCHFHGFADLRLGRDKPA